MRGLRRVPVSKACCLILCLAAAPVVWADPTGVIVEDKTPDLPICQTGDNVPPEGLNICNVRVQFGSPTDNLLSVGFSNITTDDPNGFYQNGFGSDTAPPAAFIPVFPDLVCDSFVSIGLKTDPELGIADATSTDPDFDSDLFNCVIGCGGVVGGWFNSNPPNGQGTASNYPNNEVLIAQFAVRPGFSVSGAATVFFNTGIPFPIEFECFAQGGAACETNPDLCNDGNDCTQDVCNPADPGADANGCVNPPEAEGTECEADGDLCTIDQCDGQGNCMVAAVIDCAGPTGPCDGGQQCDPGTGMCIDLPDAPASTECEADGDLCTLDHCDGSGNCVNLDNVQCAGPSGPCDGGQECDPATGTCTDLPDAPASTDCEADGNLCTIDHCDGVGNCVNLDLVQCDGPADPCAGGQQCNPANGLCEDMPDAPASTPCEADGDLCTLEHCNGQGSCVMLDIVQCQPAAPPCEAGQQCDPATGQCEDLPDAPVSTDCEADGDLCTMDHCDGQGACVLLAAVDCAGPTGPCDGGQTCDPASGQCVDLPDAPASTPCEGDMDVCTVDHCDGMGQCVVMQDLDCDDGNACTDDLCDPVDGCQNPISQGLDCADDSDCAAGESCVDCLCVPVEGPSALLDIKPGSCPNPFNVKSNGKLPVALVGTANFDVNNVDISTIQLQRTDGVGGSVAPLEGPQGPHSVIEDAATPYTDQLCGCHALEGDGILDLSMKFSRPEMTEVLQLGGMQGDLIQLTVTGQTLDGQPFSASDCVLLVGLNN